MANGVYTNVEMVESIILDLNNLPKGMIAGQFIQSCALVAQMGQKLACLRNGIKKEIENKNKIIEELKQQLRNTGTEVVDMPIEEFVQQFNGKDGVNNDN
jgi:hypothetical protein